MNPNTTGMLFGNPVENQRGILVWNEGYWNDPTLLFWQQANFPIASGTANYFPFAGLEYHKNAIRNEKRPTHIQYDNNGMDLGVWWGDNEESERFAAAASWIVNMELGLGDGRYGGTDQGGALQYTGVCVPLSKEDVVNKTPIDVDVWGGDCFINKVAIKVNNSNMLPMAYYPKSGGWAETDFKPEENAGSWLPNVIAAIGGWLGDSDLIEGLIGWKTGSYLDAVEILEYYTESNVNAALASNRGIYRAADDGVLGTYNQEYIYDYDPDYGRGDNKAHQWESKRIDCERRRGRFDDMVVWTDAYLPDTQVRGFDRIRANNYFNGLDSRFGGLSRLISDPYYNLWAIQQKASVVLNVGVAQIETLDNVQLTIGSGDVIDKVRAYNSTEFGSQHFRSVVKGSDGIYFIDAARGHIVRTTGGAVQSISGGKFLMEGYFKKLLAAGACLPEYAVSSYYDICQRQYWAAVCGDAAAKETGIGVRECPLLFCEYKDFPAGYGGRKGILWETEELCEAGVALGSEISGIVVFSEKIGEWVTRIDTGSRRLLGGVALDKRFVLLGDGGTAADNTGVYLWGYGEDKSGYGAILGEAIESSWVSVFAGGAGGSSIFDVLMLYGDEAPDWFDAQAFDWDGGRAHQCATEIRFKNKAYWDKAVNGIWYATDIRENKSRKRMGGQVFIARFFGKAGRCLRVWGVAVGGRSAY